MTARLRMALLVLTFGVQAAGIVYARFVPTRYLCWAPYDQMSFYRIEVARDGRPFTAAEIESRYRMPAVGRENRSIHHVLNTVAQYEATYGARDHVIARIVYRINGGPEQTWSSRE